MSNFLHAGKVQNLWSRSDNHWQADRWPHHDWFSLRFRTLPIYSTLSRDHGRRRLASTADCCATYGSIVV